MVLLYLFFENVVIAHVITYRYTANAYNTSQPRGKTLQNAILTLTFYHLISKYPRIQLLNPRYSMGCIQITSSGAYMYIKHLYEEKQNNKIGPHNSAAGERCTICLVLETMSLLFSSLLEEFFIVTENTDSTSTSV